MEAEIRSLRDALTLAHHEIRQLHATIESLREAPEASAAYEAQREQRHSVFTTTKLGNSAVALPP